VTPAERKAAAALRKAGWRITAAARAMGVNHKTLWARIRRSADLFALYRKHARKGVGVGRPPGGHELTHDDVRAAIARCATRAAAARELGCSRQAVDWWCTRYPELRSVAEAKRAAELSARLAAQRVAHEQAETEAAARREAARAEHCAVMVEAFRQHGSVAAVARALGVHVQTVYWHLRDPAIAAAVAPYRRDGRARSEAA